MERLFHGDRYDVLVLLYVAHVAPLKNVLKSIFFLFPVEDSERNDGSEQRPYFMSKQLMKILGRKNAVSRKKYREIGKKMSRRSTPRFASFSDRNTRPAVSFAEPVSVVLASTSAANTAPITSSPVQIRTRGMKQFR